MVEFTAFSNLPTTVSCEGPVGQNVGMLNSEVMKCGTLGRELWMLHVSMLVEKLSSLTPCLSGEAISLPHLLKQALFSL